MATLINMPKLSDTMEEGGIGTWLKKEGDFVEEGEELVEIETDKATMEYASPEEGYLLKIIATNGQAVPLQQPIAVIGEKGENIDLEALLAASGKNTTATKAEAESIKQPVSAQSNQESGTTHSSEMNSNDQQRLKASPLAKKMADEKGLDLSKLQGSGPGGRVIAQDVQGAQASSSLSSSTRSPVALGGAASEKIPHTMMRKTIAKRLLQGKKDAPHFYLTVNACMDAFNNWRQELNQHPKVIAKEWVKVSINDMLMLAVSRALLDHPEVNSSWQDEFIERHFNAHVAMAVALPSGLVTPVIFNAQNLGVRQIAEESKRLAKIAKAGGLKPEEYQGGTFTVSNLGMTRVESFTAIINPPQACILAVGQTQKVPVVDEHDQIVIRSQMKMTLSCDHRVVDGMVGAKFLETLLEYIEKPIMMLS